jgi:hypothetical protein
VRVILGWLRVAIQRDLIEQSVPERLLRAGLFVVLLWLAIWWARS